MQQRCQGLVLTWCTHLKPSSYRVYSIDAVHIFLTRVKFIGLSAHTYKRTLSPVYGYVCTFYLWLAIWMLAALKQS